MKRRTVSFFLVIDSTFFRERETEHFIARWHIDHTTAKQIHDALSKLYASLSDTEVVSEGKILDLFLDELKGVNDAYKNEEVMKRWLSLSKHIGSNPLDEWGLVTAPAIRIKGVRDYAYLAVKRRGSPMHFSEVASAIGTLFSKKAHIATTHNELIKDPRFVLVGRGLYALTEWGYRRRPRRHSRCAQERGPNEKDEIIKQVKSSFCMTTRFS